MSQTDILSVKPVPVSTFDINMNKSQTIQETKCKSWHNTYAHLYYGNSLDYYSQWESPDVIISDGAYGILGFEGDTSDHCGLPQWYEAHVAAWAMYATAKTTLWFWNSEIGWATVHPVLEKYGWQYQNCNIWNKGIAHIAGNINTQTIRRFPVVTEVCVQYTLEPKINGLTLKKWLRYEWKRTGLPLRKANEACGVRDAATRKYFDQGNLWYFPPAELFEKMQKYANLHGKPEGRPYFSLDGITPCNAVQWEQMRAKFFCPHGVTNVWDRPPVSGKERIKTLNGQVAHLNQKPLDLMRRIIDASSTPGDVLWEPFGGLFSGCYAGAESGRKCFGAEVNADYFQLAVNRFETGNPNPSNFLFQI
ncbi:MAG: site-specific DNA-methyltransferase [Thermoguttaceae bacterium]|nr:site-specific DNA-methyltransferase [Thermoguttaceae bacterium]MBR0191243.1 site-specific DNA-methyltransferase [Thermoguttaceae bacterium]